MGLKDPSLADVNQTCCLGSLSLLSSPINSVCEQGSNGKGFPGCVTWKSREWNLASIYQEYH